MKFIIAFIGFSCPGWFGNFIIPNALKPIACKQNIEVVLLHSRKEADELVKEKGQSAKLYQFLDSKLTEKEIKWHEEVQIQP